MSIVAYGYLRVSGQSQIDKSGFNRQQEEIEHFANNNDYTIAEFFKEKGVSGTTIRIDRPAFQDMVASILANGVNTIIVERLDRLARAYTAQESLLVYLASKDITLINASTGEDVTAAIKGDPMKLAIVQMQAVFSELEKNLLVRKLGKARAKIRATGKRCDGAKPYGYENEEEQAVIKKVRLRRRKKSNGKQESLRSIAAWLNDQDIPTKRGGSWSAVQVSNLLK
jgi:DNA invertase Pin-like site-specific DNA recombinase